MRIHLDAESEDQDVDQPGDGGGEHGGDDADWRRPIRALCFFRQVRGGLRVGEKTSLVSHIQRSRFLLTRISQLASKSSNLCNRRGLRATNQVDRRVLRRREHPLAHLNRARAEKLYDYASQNGNDFWNRSQTENYGWRL